MSLLSPRSLIHRGVISSSAFWIDPALIGEEEARARVLAIWTTATKVWSVAGGYLVQLPTSSLENALHSPGLPLTSQSGGLTASPLTTSELTVLPLLQNHVLLPRAGQLDAVPLTTLIDPSTWLEVEDWRSIPVHELADPLPPPKLVAPPPPKVDLHRQLLGSTAPDERNRFSESLGKSAPSPKESLLSKIRSWLANLQQPRKEAKSPGSTTSSVRRTSSTQAPPRAPRRNPFRDAFAQLLDLSGLLRLFDSWHSRYLARLLRMFEQGDLMEALRHAIPLADIEKDPARFVPMLGFFQPRKDLSIRPQKVATAGSVGLSNDLFQYMRQLYDDAYKRLVQQGRFQEAAFILAELLQKNEEAVSLLEQHGLLEQAAELAEGRQLAPGLVIRQWFLAGKLERAVAIARRTGAFSDAILRLQSKRPDLADALRITWAFTLAAAGDYLAAVDVCRPVASARAQLADWLNCATELGGRTAGKALALEASYFPASFPATREKFLTHIESDTAAAFTAGFAGALTGSLAQTPELQSLSRECLRAFIREWAQGYFSPEKDLYSRLREAAHDTSLRADLPSEKRWYVNTARNKPSLVIEIHENDSGTTAISDAVLLPDHKIVLALGEAGALLLNREGRKISHFDQPIETLVVSSSGARLIGMARRGSVSRLCRIDAVRRTCEFWCEADISTFARDFDGSRWFVACRDTVYSIDSTSKRFEALWSVSDVGFVQAMVLAPTSLIFVGGPELWFYQLPAMTLRQRQSIARTDVRLIVNICPQSFKLVAEEENGESWSCQNAPDLKPFENRNHAIAWEFGAFFQAAALRTPSGVVVEAFSGQERFALVTLHGSAQVRLRIRGSELLITDNRGRVLALDPLQKSLFRNFRI